VFSDEELSTTAMTYLQGHRNMLDRPHPFIDDWLANKEDQEGGERMIVRWKVARHSSGQQLTTGYEPITMTGAPILKPGTQGWFYNVRPVMISERDEIINRGKAAVLDLLKTRVQDTEDGTRADLEDAVLRANVTTMSDLLPFNGADDTDGFLEHAAVGSQTNTVHGVAKSTYSTLVGFQNQRYDGAGSFSANGLIGLQDGLTRITELSTEARKMKGYLSIAGSTNLKRAVLPQERYTSKDDLDAGRMVEMFGGVQFRVTSRLPNSGTTTTADPWTALVVDWASLHFVGQKGYVMMLDEFRPVSGHIVRAAFMHTFGQNVARFFGSSFVLFDAETW
jgi:hypothetical protein